MKTEYEFNREHAEELSKLIIDLDPSDLLKPCPFCGGKAVEIEPKPNDRGKFWKIRCNNCYATIGGTHRRMNREAWNRRAKDE